jgi:arsenate reductase (glutaredoxin)
MQLFGISNCATIKKARTWLTDNSIDMPFHDFKKRGHPPDAGETQHHQTSGIGKR